MEDMVLSIMKHAGILRACGEGLSKNAALWRLEHPCRIVLGDSSEGDEDDLEDEDDFDDDDDFDSDFDDTDDFDDDDDDDFDEEEDDEYDYEEDVDYDDFDE